MKLSVSLPEEDVKFLDQYAKYGRYESRSAVLHEAVRLLKVAELQADYEAAWKEWSESGEQELWDQTTADGLTDSD
jgi:putative addiction module CopG family antidote